MLLNDKERDERIEIANEKRNKQMEKLNKIKAKKEALKETARKIEQAKAEKEVCVTYYCIFVELGLLTTTANCD